MTPERERLVREVEDAAFARRRLDDPMPGRVVGNYEYWEADGRLRVALHYLNAYDAAHKGETDATA